MRHRSRSRRPARLVAAVAMVSAFLVAATGVSGAYPAPVSVTGEPVLTGPEDMVVPPPAAEIPKREYKEGTIPDDLDPTAAGEQWYESGVDMGMTFNCSFPDVPGMLGRSWVGWFGKLGETPTTSQPVYYTKIGWGVSSGCGGSYVHAEQFLPPGTQIAVSQENPVYCWHNKPHESELRPVTAAQGCPQQPKQGQQGGISWDPSDGSAAWPTAITTMWEIWIPVKSTQPLDAQPSNPCKSCIQAGLWFIDGSSNPWGYPKVPIFVGGTGSSGPSVSYPAPSIDGQACCDNTRPGEEASANLIGWIFTTGKPGATEIQIDDDQPGAPYRFVLGGGRINQSDITNLGPDIQQTWGLTFSPDTQWYWRMCFTPDDGSGKKCGVEQTFNVPRPPDNTPPDTTIDVKPAAKSGTRSARFEFSSSKPFSTFLCSVDGAAFSACLSPLTLTDLPDGQHTFAVKAVSQTHVEDGSPASYTWTVNPPPDTTITSGPSGTTKKTSATFTFTATEATKAFKCKLDAGLWKGCASGSITYTGLSRAQHTFRVKAVDTLGAVDKTPATRTWTITR